MQARLGSARHVAEGKHGVEDVSFDKKKMLVRESGRKRGRGDRAASDGESCFSRFFRCVRRRLTGSPTPTPTPAPTPTPTPTTAAVAAEEAAGSRKRSRAAQEHQGNSQRALRRQRTGDVPSASDFAPDATPIASGVAQEAPEAPERAAEEAPDGAPVVCETAPVASNAVIQWFRANRSTVLEEAGITIANILFVWRFVVHGDPGMRTARLSADYVLMLIWAVFRYFKKKHQTM